jgi:hypothetical protein
VAPGASWTIPLSRHPLSYHGTRQDLAISLLAQLESPRWLAQAEISFGGLNASNPQFNLLAARIGFFLLRGEADVSLSMGAGYMTYKADSYVECADFGCDKFHGSGVATVAEIAVRFTPDLPVRGALFLHAVVPLFDVIQTDYGITEARAVGLVALGLRLFL